MVYYTDTVLIAWHIKFMYEIALGNKAISCLFAKSIIMV